MGGEMKPVILKYKGYRIVKEDELNLKLEVYKDVIDYDKIKTHKKWVFIGFYASLRLALGSLMNELVSTPHFDAKTLDSQAKHILKAISAFEAFLDDWVWVEGVRV